MDRKPKTVFQLDTPYTAVEWPQITSQNQDIILELLISLLSPVGQHRHLHTVPSKGKRSRKRKRREETSTGANLPIEKEKISSVEVELSPFLLVGLNSVTRHLELLSRMIRPKQSQNKFGPAQSMEIHTADAHAGKHERCLPPHIAAVFVCRSSQPSALHAHLPQLIATASLAHPDASPTRLVQLPQGCENRLSASLGLPRTSFVGILEGTPRSKHLITLIREAVSPVEVLWLQEVQNAEYKPLKINHIQTTAPTAKGTKKTK